MKAARLQLPEGRMRRSVAPALALAELDEDMLVLILAQLRDARDLSRATAVNRRFREVALRSTLYKSLVLERLPCLESCGSLPWQAIARDLCEHAEEAWPRASVMDVLFIVTAYPYRGDGIARVASVDESGLLRFSLADPGCCTYSLSPRGVGGALARTPARGGLALRFHCSHLSDRDLSGRQLCEDLDRMRLTVDVIRRSDGSARRLMDAHAHFSEGEGVVGGDYQSSVWTWHTPLLAMPGVFVSATMEDADLCVSCTRAADNAGRYDDEPCEPLRVLSNVRIEFTTRLRPEYDLDEPGLGAALMTDEPLFDATAGQSDLLQLALASFHLPVAAASPCPPPIACSAASARRKASAELRRRWPALGAQASGTGARRIKGLPPPRELLALMERGPAACLPPKPLALRSTRSQPACDGVLVLVRLSLGEGRLFSACAPLAQAVGRRSATDPFSMRVQLGPRFVVPAEAHATVDVSLLAPSTGKVVRITDGALGESYNEVDGQQICECCERGRREQRGIMPMPSAGLQLNLEYALRFVEASDESIPHALEMVGIVFELTHDPPEDMMDWTEPTPLTVRETLDIFSALVSSARAPAAA